MFPNKLFDIACSPLNNFSHFYDFYALECPILLGGNCIRKIIQVKEILELNNFAVKALIADNSTHHAALIVDEQKNSFFYDPSLLQLDPVSLDCDSVLKSPTVLHKAYMDNPSYLTLSANKGFSDILFAGWNAPNSFREHKWMNFFLLDEALDEIPKTYDMEFQRVLPKKFYFRYFDKQLGYLRSVLFDCQEETFRIGTAFTPDFRDIKGDDYKHFESQTGFHLSDLMEVMEFAKHLAIDFHNEKLMYVMDY